MATKASLATAIRPGEHVADELAARAMSAAELVCVPVPSGCARHRRGIHRPQAPRDARCGPLCWTRRMRPAPRHHADEASSDRVWADAG